MTQSELPRPVAAMCADLAGQGFDVLDERVRPAGGLRLVLQGPVRATPREWLETFVAISAEDGLWTISVRFEGMSRWVSPSTWRAYLDRSWSGLEDDLVRQTGFVRHRLSEAARAIRTEPRVETDLVLLAGG